MIISLKKQKSGAGAFCYFCLLVHPCRINAVNPYFYFCRIHISKETKISKPFKNKCLEGFHFLVIGQNTHRNAKISYPVVTTSRVLEFLAAQKIIY